MDVASARTWPSTNRMAGRIRTGLELSRTLALWHHEQEKLPITAERKAELDPRVQQADEKWLALKAQLEALERAETNLLEERNFWVLLVRSEVLSEPDAVRPLGWLQRAAKSVRLSVAHPSDLPYEQSS